MPYHQMTPEEKKSRVATAKKGICPDCGAKLKQVDLLSLGIRPDGTSVYADHVERCSAPGGPPMLRGFRCSFSECQYEMATD